MRGVPSGSPAIVELLDWPAYHCRDCDSGGNEVPCWYCDSMNLKNQHRIHGEALTEAEQLQRLAVAYKLQELGLEAGPNLPGIARDWIAGLVSTADYFELVELRRNEACKGLQ